MLWSTDTCQNKVSADQYHVTISRAQVYSLSRFSCFSKVDRWPNGGFSIGPRAHVRFTCLKPGRIVWKPANTSPGLKFIQNYNFFFSTNVFFWLLLCFMFIKFKTENLIAKLQNLNRNFTFSWVSLIGFSTTWPEGATLLGWPKSIYYVWHLAEVFSQSIESMWNLYFFSATVISQEIFLYWSLVTLEMQGKIF